MYQTKPNCKTFDCPQVDLKKKKLKKEEEELCHVAVLYSHSPPPLTAAHSNFVAIAINLIAK